MKKRPKRAADLSNSQKANDETTTNNNVFVGANLCHLF